MESIFLNEKISLKNSVFLCKGKIQETNSMDQYCEIFLVPEHAGKAKDPTLLQM